jgi:hypothetical protein
MMVFFENDHCVKCDEPLGFFPEAMKMSSKKRWMAHSSTNKSRHCANHDQHHVCNWMVPGQDPDPFCRACRLNEVIPDLTVTGNPERWSKLEIAKRRCLYTFLQLGLPIESDNDEGRPALRFRFLGDSPNTPPVLTGHDNGVITINIAEADSDERERRRLKLHEPYRTLIGHLRHETGHYYWDRLIADSPPLQEFRELFGDETTDYNEALQKYYQQGPAANWTERTVTPYASLHPWEDWAETWAHYLHMVDTLETAASFRIGLNRTEREKGAPKKNADKISGDRRDFQRLLADWQPLTCVLNSFNRGMGLPDLYPFVIPGAAVEKLRFVHKVIEDTALPPTSVDFKEKPAINCRL